MSGIHSGIGSSSSTPAELPLRGRHRLDDRLREPQVVSRADPSIGVGQEQRLARHIGSVRAPHVPQAAVEEHRVARRGEDRDRARHLVGSPARPFDRVAAVRPRQHDEVPPAGHGHVGQEVRDLHRHPRSWRRLEIAVLDPAVLVPHPGRDGLVFGWVHVQMGVVHEDVGPERLGDHVEHGPVVEQPDEPPVLSQEREQMQRGGRRGASAVAGPDVVDRREQLVDERRVERAGQEHVAVFVQPGTDRSRPPLWRDRVHPEPPRPGRRPCGARLTRTDGVWPRSVPVSRRG